MNAATNQPPILTLRLGQSDQAGQCEQSFENNDGQQDDKNRGLNVESTRSGFARGFSPLHSSYCSLSPF